MAYYNWQRASWRGDAVTPWLHCASCARKLLSIVRKLRKKRR